MVDFAHPVRPAERLGNAEREAAVAALGLARDEGRLDALEHEQRVAAARAAVTWGELAPLFADLPRAAPLAAEPRGGWGGGRALGGAWGATVMAIVPFLAVGLFFIAGFVWGGWVWSWLFFLLVPIAGVVIYGPGADERRRG